MHAHVTVPVCLASALMFSCVNGTAPVHTGYPAKVLGEGLDCGGAFLIRFTGNSGEIDAKLDEESVPASEAGIYYADGLPQSYQVENLEIRIDFRKPSASEAYACTARGPAYPHIFVTGAAK